MRLNHKINSAYCGLIGWAHWDLSSDYRDTVYLAGNGRGGTTWLTELINYQNEYRIIFEPFYPQRVKIFKDYSYRQYLSPKHCQPKTHDVIEAILSGKVRNLWTDRYNKKIFCRRRIVKSIRSGLMLKWIHDNFPGMPMVLLLRHPCAVADSKMKLKWDTHLDLFLQQPDLVADHLKPFVPVIRGAKTNFIKHILMWCVENYVPLKQFKAGEILILFYEDLVRHPEIELKKLFSYIGQDYNPAIISKLKKPSLSTSKKSVIFDNEDIINSWKKHLTDTQIDQALKILKLFNLDRIYNKDFLPNPKNLYV